MGRAARGEPAEVILAEQRIPYQLKRSARRRTVAFTVEPERGLVVYAPQRLALRHLEGILRENGRWILRKTHQVAQQAARSRPLACTPGSLLPFRGGWHPLMLAAGRRRGIALEAGVLWLTLPARTLAALEPALAQEPTALRPHLEAALRDAAGTVLTERVAHYAPRLAVQPSRMRVKAQQRRWGSASAQGAVNFNWRLILAPPDVLDYVVVHELAHLRELNHSPRFWALVATHAPRHREQRAWLREHGQQLYAL